MICNLSYTAQSLQLMVESFKKFNFTGFLHSDSYCYCTVPGRSYSCSFSPLDPKQCRSTRDYPLQRLMCKGEFICTLAGAGLGSAPRQSTVAGSRSRLCPTQTLLGSLYNGWYSNSVRAALEGYMTMPTQQGMHRESICIFYIHSNNDNPHLIHSFDFF